MGYLSTSMLSDSVATTPAFSSFPVHESETKNVNRTPRPQAANAVARRAEKFLALISVSLLLLIVIVSNALRSGWKECAMRDRKREGKIIDRTELTNVDENIFYVAIPFESKKSGAIRNAYRRDMWLFKALECAFSFFIKIARVSSRLKTTASRTSM